MLGTQKLSDAHTFATARTNPGIAGRVDVEIVDGTGLRDMQCEWADLLSRAAEVNPFMHPGLVRIAAETDPDTPIRALLAWTAIEGHRQLIGIWPFAIRYPAKSPMPLRVLVAPPFPHGYLSTPVIDRSCLEETLEAMLESIAAAPELPSIVALDAMGTGGPTIAALKRVLAARGTTPRILQQTCRPKLASSLDGKQYLEQALSSSSRKKLRQHRRRLSDAGALTSEVVSAPEALPKAIEDFLLLEAAGWKGRQGTALLSSDIDASFFRASAAALSKDGTVSVHTLNLDQRPISMQLVLRAGPAAFTWKTAYDEKFQDFSPGMLLLEDYTAAFLEDDGIDFVDSCAFDDGGFMSAWSERQDVADLWIDARRGSSIAFNVLGRLQAFYRELRNTAKRRHSKLRRKSAR